MRASRRALIAVSFLVGCHGLEPVASVGGTVEGDGWSARFPDGWNVQSDAGGISASRLGRRLQRVEVRLVPDDDPALRARSPGEVALALHARVMGVRGHDGVVVLSAREARLADLPGVRAELALRDSRGLSLRALLLAARGEGGWRCIVYEAAAIRFYDRGLATFDDIASTFRVRPRLATAAPGRPEEAAP